ncbi:MAG: hypothetical protein H8E53_05965 [Planctomycetes bacterium]|nr:hypothetical protein [Planctomycetota bacterium]
MKTALKWTSSTCSLASLMAGMSLLLFLLGCFASAQGTMQFRHHFIDRGRAAGRVP